MVTTDDFLGLLPPDLLDRLAVEYQTDACNQVTLPGRAVLVCLLNGILNHPELTLRLLEEIYHRETGQTADHSSFGRRLATIPAGYFQAVCDHLHRTVRDHAARDRTPGTEALHLKRIDATIVTLSSKLMAFGLRTAHGTGRDRLGTPDTRHRRQIKSVFVLDGDDLPQFLRLCSEQSELCDSNALGQTMEEHAAPNDLWVFDKGCNARDRLLAVHNAGAFFVTPHHQQSLHALRTLYAAESETPPEPPCHGVPPLYVLRVEEAIFQSSQKEARYRSMPMVVVHTLRFDTRKRSWVPFTLLTNLPVSADGRSAGPYSFDEIGDVYRSRWDIEIFFRFLKSRLGYRHLTSRTANGIAVMIYTTVIAALTLIWYKRKTGINRGWRSVQFWLAEDLRDWTIQVLVDAFALRSMPLKT
jgi:hypothetical protein